MEPGIEDRIHAGTRAVWAHRHVGLEALALDPDLVRSKPAGHGQVDPAEVVGQRQPLLNDAFAVGLGADKLGNAARLKCAGEDLGRGGRVAVYKDHKMDRAIGGPAARRGRDLGGRAGRVLLVRDRPGRDELAPDLDRVSDVAAEVATQIEDDIVPAGFDDLLQRCVEL